MSEEFRIQCQACGTVYNDLEEVCPYCGTPQSDLQEEISVEVPFIEDEPFIGQELEEEPEDEPFAEDPYDEIDVADPLLDDSEPESDDASYLPEVDYQDDHFIPAGEAAFAVGEDVFADDDIFSVVEDEPIAADEAETDYLSETALAPVFGDFANDEDTLLADEYDDDDDDDIEDDEEKPRYFRRMRLLTGCLGTLVCVTLLYGSIGLFAAIQGLQERAVEIETEAEVHFERGQTHLSAGAIELAIAEFERALNLNPNLLAARQALREAQNISLSQPTPTSETRSAAAVTLLKQAEIEIDAEAWEIAAETLSKVRDLDPDYEPDRVSGLIFDVNYQLGLDYLAAENVAQAALALEAALSENPDDQAANETLTNISLYQVGLTAVNDDLSQEAVEALSELFENDPDFFDVEAQLAGAYQDYGDELALIQEWCEAEAQYTEASLLAPRDTSLKKKVAQSGEQCEGISTASPESTPTRSTSTAANPQRTPTPVAPADGRSLPDDTPASDSPGGGLPAGGRIYYSAFNPNESRWEILAVSAGGGTRNVIVTEATMPDVSPNGQLLLYRSEAQESEGFHLFNLATGEDNRITIFRQDVLPRWGGNNAEYLFAAQEPATNRWLIQLGFADGKGDAVILRDGRTPDWSSDGSLIAYQGTDPEGNQPGIYIISFDGGEPQRLTTHQSDRMPSFSPNNQQIVYMSTKGGNWDLYVVGVNGGEPRQLTTYGGNDGLPVWSPDGSKIAYVSDSGGSWNIVVVAAAGGTPQKIIAWDGRRDDWLLAQISWAR